MTDLVSKILSNKSQENVTRLLEGNILHLHKYDEYMINESRKETTRANNLRNIMLVTLEIPKLYESWSKNDVENYFTRLSTDSKIQVSAYTREIRKAIVTKYFRWFYKKTSKDAAPEVVSGLKINHKAYDKFINPNDFLTEDEVKLLVDICDHPRDSCFIMVLYESGARITEILSLNIKDVKFLGDSVKIYIRKSKTVRRPVDLLLSVPYLQAWLQKHPDKNNPDAPLFISFSPSCYGTRLMSHSTLEILQKLKKRCGITKKINHHLFRHMAITRCLLSGMPHAVVKRRFGLSNNTNMLERYCWISDDDVEDSYRVACGYEPNKASRNSIETLKPKKCWRCGSSNPVTNKYCNSCFTNLDYESVGHDLDVLEMVKTRFAELEGVDIDKMLVHYQHLKAETKDMQRLLDCFDGNNEVKISLVRKQLGLSDDDALEILQYLVSAEQITFDKDMIYLKDKEEFRKFISIQKRYISFNSD